MACACIGIYRKERLDESYRWILRQYQKHVIEDTCWFSIELEWHRESTYTTYEKQQLTKVFGKFPEQEILIFGECDRIFVAAYEIIKHTGGLLYVNISSPRERVNLYPGKKIEVFKKKHRNPLKHMADRWLVDHRFIREFFWKENENYERFKLYMFLPSA
jgi:hypothetical protein